MSVNVRRISEALRYEAPNHFDVRGLRLQGLDAGGAEQLWVGLSHFLPDAKAGPDAGALEKVYVVIAGHMTLISEGSTVVLGPLDSVTIPANVEREVRNDTNEVATMLVIMPRAKV